MRLGFVVEWLVLWAVLFVAWQWTDGQPFWLGLIVTWVVLMIPTGIHAGVDTWRKRRRSY